jgi:hypothetical protein
MKQRWSLAVGLDEIIFLTMDHVVGDFAGGLVASSRFVTNDSGLTICNNQSRVAINYVARH